MISKQTLGTFSSRNDQVSPQIAFLSWARGLRLLFSNKLSWKHVCCRQIKEMWRWCLHTHCWLDTKEITVVAETKAVEQAFMYLTVVLICIFLGNTTLLLSSKRLCIYTHIIQGWIKNAMFNDVCKIWKWCHFLNFLECSKTSDSFQFSCWVQVN